MESNERMIRMNRARNNKDRAIMAGGESSEFSRIGELGCRI
jgi:hypothetical protein